MLVRFGRQLSEGCQLAFDGAQRANGNLRRSLDAKSCPGWNAHNQREIGLGRKTGLNPEPNALRAALRSRYVKVGAGYESGCSAVKPVGNQLFSFGGKPVS